MSVAVFIVFLHFSNFGDGVTGVSLVKSLESFLYPTFCHQPSCPLNDMLLVDPHDEGCSMVILCCFLSCLDFSLLSMSVVASPVDMWMAVDPLLMGSSTLLTCLFFILQGVHTTLSNKNRP